MKRLTFRSVYREGVDFSTEIAKRSVATNAACIAFYFFLSAVPFIILLCSQLPYTGISQEALTEAVVALTPDPVDGFVETVIGEAYTVRIALFSVSLLTLLWASAKVVIAVIRSLDAVYGEKDERNYFAVALSALLITVVMLVGSGALIFLSVRGKTADALLRALFPGEYVYRTASVFLRNLLLYAVSVLFYALAYRWFPAGRRRFLLQLPGAALAGLGVALFSALFGAYYARGGVYRTFYGSLAGLALSLLWLYVCVIIFLLGAAFNARYAGRLRELLRKKRKAAQ